MNTKTFLVLFGLFILASCDIHQNSDRIITGEGEIVSKDILLDGFSEITHDGIAHFNISTGKDHKVTVKAQQNVIDVMVFAVRNQELYVGFEKDTELKNIEPIEIDITLPELTKITSTGTGNFVLSGNKQTSLEIQLVGTGNVDAYGLEVDTCIINSVGTGFCKVHAHEVLDVTVTGTGLVYYKGNPEIHSVITGVGQLVNDN